jgi:L-fuculose-phosphate aldolase
MLITPSAVPFDELQPDQLLRVSLNGEDIGVPKTSGLRVSTEWQLHAAILSARPEVGTVLHAHPPYATAVACLRRGIPPFHYMVVVAGGTSIRCADYATFGTPELVSAAVEALEGRTACLLANHGMVALGDSPAQALALAVEVEALSEMYCHALAAGAPVLLYDAEMSRVLAAFDSYRRAGG